MPFYVLYDTATGRPLSFSSVAASPGVGQAVAELAEKPADAQAWDVASRTFVARAVQPPSDLVADIMGDATVIANMITLLAAQKQAIQDRMQFHLERVLVRWY
jgi:hypothetical protein